MAISEKTVELNVSRSVVNRMRRKYKVKAYALGTTQGEEQMFGLDVEVTDGTWSAGCIQYKRLYKMATPAPGVSRWNLNRTKGRDQHTLLCELEAAGYPVFYCFPKFDDEAPLGDSLPPLWKRVWWIRPSALVVPAPIDKHHHLTRDSAGTWLMYSSTGTPFELEPTSFEEVVNQLLGYRNSPQKLSQLKEQINNLSLKSWKKHRSNGVNKLTDAEVESEKAEYFADLWRGMNLLVLAK